RSYGLREKLGEEAFPKRADQYLDDWAADARGWLRKYYPPASDEAHYDLTPPNRTRHRLAHRLPDTPLRRHRIPPHDRLRPPARNRRRHPNRSRDAHRRT